MTWCPNCRNDMTPHTVSAHGSLRPIEIEACAPCNLFWFDRHENVRLSRQAVLDLFKYVTAAAAVSRTALASTFKCPRCSVAMAFSHDLQRTTRFNYWRCPRDQGQLITFQQFLRAKNFIRAPSADELARLRATVRQIACSQCGAPVDLAKDPACTHCGAAIALIDPDGVAKALQDLTRDRRGAATDEQDLRAGLTGAQVAALFDLHRLRDGEPEPDLLAVGIRAVGAWLTGRFG